ncbi:MAG: tetratricopeptide repeat protein [Elusimicrobiota bacterium]
MRLKTSSSFVAILFTLSVSTSAQTVDHEEFALIGWNDACSAAFSHYAYPVLGEAIVSEPIRTQVGTLTIGPGQQKAEVEWLVDWSGRNTWQEGPAKQAVAALAKTYKAKGFVEHVRPDPIATRPGLEETIRSTSTFAVRSAQWPGPGWRFASAYISPLTTCALFLFEDENAKARYTPVLARIYNPSARAIRARAHLANGLLLFNDGDLVGALAETGIAAAEAPENGPARYHHAAMLCLSGMLADALDELTAALKLDPRYKNKARQDKDFESLSRDRRFKDLLRGTKVKASDVPDEESPEERRLIFH